MLPELMTAMAAAADHIRKWPGKTVQLLHHNDADGLTAGAILIRAFERAGFAVERYCLEKPYPVVLEKVFKQTDRLIVFADFAGRIAPLISDLNQSRNLVVILDHHKAAPVEDDRILNLNPELYGLAGDRDVSASTTAYLFAYAFDPSNADLAPLAVIGAVGDGFYVNGVLAGPNRMVALEAERQGTLEIMPNRNGEKYVYHSPGGVLACELFSTYLDTLGAAGYYRNGPEVGIRAVLVGLDPKTERMLDGLKALQDELFDKEAERLLNGGLQETEHIQWFHVENRFEPMGVKMIGVFCEKFKDRLPFSPGKFVAGFQTIPANIPGFGKIPMDQVKISMRVSAALRRKIRSGQAPGLYTLLPVATGCIGGFADACHSLAAATTIGVGKEAALIQAMETMLSDYFANRLEDASQ